MVARLIVRLRISVLFGLILTIISSVIGVAAGAVQGYFGGWTDRCSSVSSNLGIGAVVYLLLIIFGAGAGLLRAARHPAVTFMGVRSSASFARNPARSKFRVHPGGARARRLQRDHHVPASVAERDGRDHDVPAVHPVVVGDDLTALDFLGFGLPPGSPSLGELLSQGKTNIQAPWLGLAGFFSVAIMLSLLIFIGEAVRDAFDPRKTFR